MRIFLYYATLFLTTSTFLVSGGKAAAVERGLDHEQIKAILLEGKADAKSAVVQKLFLDLDMADVLEDIAAAAAATSRSIIFGEDDTALEAAGVGLGIKKVDKQHELVHLARIKDNAKENEGVLDDDDDSKEDEHQVPRKSRKIREATEEEKHDIVMGRLQVINIDYSSKIFDQEDERNNNNVKPGQVIVLYCKMDYSQQKQDPSKAPFHMNSIRSNYCDHKEAQVRVDLYEIINLIRAYDALHEVHGDDVDMDYFTHPRSIEPTAFLYHTGRTGSTLAANALMANEPSRTKLYSEPQAALQALLACHKTRVNCNIEKAGRLLKDTIFLMGRTNDPMEDRMYLKLLPTSILAADIVSMAFPNTPWLFIYRDPVQVLVSNMKDKSAENGPGPYCTEGMMQRKMSEFMYDVVAKSGRDALDLTRVKYCSAYLATLMEAAQEHHLATTTGFMINYSELKNGILTSPELQAHLGLSITPEGEERMNAQYSVYSKRMLRPSRKVKSNLDDSLEKMESASAELVAAAELFMTPPYNRLEAMADKNSNKWQNQDKDEDVAGFLPSLVAGGVDVRVLTTRNNVHDAAYYEYDPRHLLGNPGGCPDLGMQVPNTVCCPGGTAKAVTDVSSSSDTCYISYDPCPPSKELPGCSVGSCSFYTSGWCATEPDQKAILFAPGRGIFKFAACPAPTLAPTPNPCKTCSGKGRGSKDDGREMIRMKKDVSGKCFDVCILEPWQGVFESSFNFECGTC